MRLSDVSRRRAGKTSAVRARRTERARVYVCARVCIALAAAAATAARAVRAAAVAASCVGVAARLRRYAAKMSWSRGHIAVPVGSVCWPPRAVLFYGRARRGAIGVGFSLLGRARGTPPDVFLTYVFLRRRPPLALSLLSVARPTPAAATAADEEAIGGVVFPPFYPYSYFFGFRFPAPATPPRHSPPGAFFPLPAPTAHPHCTARFFRFLSHRLRVRRDTLLLNIIKIIVHHDICVRRHASVRKIFLRVSIYFIIIFSNIILYLLHFVL